MTIDEEDSKIADRIAEAAKALNSATALAEDAGLQVHIQTMRHGNRMSGGSVDIIAVSVRGKDLA